MFYYPIAFDSVLLSLDVYHYERLVKQKAMKGSETHSYKFLHISAPKGCVAVVAVAVTRISNRGGNN